MIDYIPLSTLNDFIFCPYSIYLHSVYMEADEDIYKALPQTKGTIAHQGIDMKKSSTKKGDIMSLPVFSDTFGISGKIDIYKSDNTLNFVSDGMVIVSYDIADDKMRSRFSKMLKKNGAIRLQFSVYELQNTKRIIDNLLAKIEALSKHFTPDDSVVLFDVDSENITKFGNAIHRDQPIVYF